MARAASGPRPTTGRWVGSFRVHAWIGRGSRADVWWAESDLGPVALRVPFPETPRARFDAAQRRAYEASGRRGDLRPEGALEPLIRGDDLAQLIDGAPSNGPVSHKALASLAHGILTALIEHPHGHGDLAPHHVLVGEAGTVRLIDADPLGFDEAPRRPRRAPFVRSAPDASRSDLGALARAITDLWSAGRLPEEHPPPWVSELREAQTPRAALEALEGSLGPVDAYAFERERARLVRRLCPERRAAWAEVARAASVASAEVRPSLSDEPESSTEPTRVDVLVDATMDEGGHPPSAMEAVALGSPAPLHPGADATDPVAPHTRLELEAEPRGATSRTLASEAPESSAPWEPPPLRLPDEAVVPTQIVRHRSRSPSPAPTAAAPPPPEAPRPRAETETYDPVPSPGDLVMPVPEEELRRTAYDRRLTLALAAVVIALLVLVAGLVLDRLDAAEPPAPTRLLR